MIAIDIYAVQTLKGQCEGLANPLVKHECYCPLELKGTVSSLNVISKWPKDFHCCVFFLESGNLGEFFLR